jgi:hypothetical protein
MLVDVTFDGVSLAKGANAHADGPGNNGWFVELEQPMPVGTLLTLAGEAQAAVRVERVVEGVGAGMLVMPTTPVEKAKPAEVKPADVKPAEVKPADVKPADVTPAQPAAKKAEKVESDGDEEAKGTNGASNGSSRRKRRKTNPGL